MKKTLLVILLSLVAAGCSSKETDQGSSINAGVHPTNYETMRKNMRTIEVDGCEYLVYSYYRGYSGYGFMAHKGNCRNPIHRNSMEYEKETVQRTY